jgi:hypothetical protein
MVFIKPLMLAAGIAVAVPIGRNCSPRRGRNIAAQGQRSGVSREAPPWVVDGVMRSP